MKTITEIREAISRANKRLKTVDWELYHYDILEMKGAKCKRVQCYRLVKNIQLRDTNNLTYWWPEILFDGPKSKFIKWFRAWCENNKRDTLSKCVTNHADWKRGQQRPKIKKSEKVAAIATSTQTTMFTHQNGT